ncbi:IS481 family transposase, partial [Terrabacter sp. NPDC080008]|uniref:IS481 family transposase n=1 Tax=Terrabacter sp. NPDC080008 TaxID=3155176 RepID=UPI00344DD21E
VADSVEVRVAEMRRAHPRWGAKRIRLELLRKPVEGGTIPAVRTIVRILHRQGLSAPRPRKRPRSSYRRFERPGPMQLWGIDIVGGIRLVDPSTGVVRDAKLVTGVDDHSRYCVMAAVVERATARAVCLAFAQALSRFGVPQEVITDNGRQFTGRFGRHGAGSGEVLFDKICRKNGITHRLTAPASPNQNGKVERFHGTFRPEFLDGAGPFTSVEEAQAAVDAWVHEYNTGRPHQALDDTVPVTPSQRFTPVPQAERDVLEMWLPPTLSAVTSPTSPTGQDLAPSEADAQMSRTGVVDGYRGGSGPVGPFGPRPGDGDPVELDLVVPPSGNMKLGPQQLWLGPAHAGRTVRVWADCDVVHLSMAASRVKTVRSQLSVADLCRLRANGAVPAGPSPLPRPEQGEAIELERVVSRTGLVALGPRRLLAAEILAGRRVGIRIEPATLQFFDPDTRQLLRVWPNPLTREQVLRLRGARRAGPPPRPSSEPVTVQGRAASNGVILVCRQRVNLGAVHAGQIVTVAVSETSLSIDLGDGDTRVVPRTTTLPVRNMKAFRPRAETG